MVAVVGTLFSVGVNSKVNMKKKWKIKLILIFIGNVIKLKWDSGLYLVIIILHYQIPLLNIQGDHSDQKNLMNNMI